jgi:hypothetical protein
MGLEDLNKLAGQADRYNDSFVNAVCNAGLLLHNKKWMPVRAQHGERQTLDFAHSISFCNLYNFWPMVTVSESHVYELERGSLELISDSADVDGVNITYWYKKIYEAAIHRIKLEMDFQGTDFFTQ